MRVLFVAAMLVLYGGPASAELAVKIGVLREVRSRETISILDIPGQDSRQQHDR
jgi:hypothetical protein